MNPLDSLYQKTTLRVSAKLPVVFFSDLHKGGGGPADDFAPNESIFQKAMDFYKPWYKIVLGDAYELYQFRWDEIRTHYKFDLELGGNHDSELGRPLSAILEAAGQEIFLSHGHRGDILCDQLAWVGRAFTDYIWKPLEMLGIKDPPPKVGRHAAQRQKLIEWANEKGIMHVHGHIHLQSMTGIDIDCGCSVQPGIVECVELTEKGFRLVQWTKNGRGEV